MRRTDKKALLAAGTIVLSLLLLACSRKDPVTGPAVLSPTATGTPVITGEVTGPVEKTTPTPEGNVAAPTPSGTEDEGEPSITLMESDTQVTDGPAPTATPTQPVTPTPVNKPDSNEGQGNATGTPAPTGTPTEQPEEKTEAELLREADWAATFLARIPEFTFGTYAGYTPEDTFDVARFESVALEDVTAYIIVLEDAGFNLEVQSAERGSNISFSAVNEDRWMVSLNYADEALSLASGYDIHAEDAENLRVQAWTQTILVNLPEFTAGVFVSAGPDAGRNSYCAVFDSVQAEDARAYIEEVRSLGFESDADSGDSDGIIWYSAGDGSEYQCNIIYYDGVLKITCSR